MASRRIIQDSDDDGGGTRSPSNSPSKADGVFQPSTTETFATTSMIQTSSTDPMLFNAIYETHLGTNLENSHQLPSHEQSPIFESFIHDPHMSSSDNSGQKIKRRKTTHLSSLTSVSEQKDSTQKAKRTQSIREVDDLTQITTPRASGDAKERHIWAFLNSSASNKSPESNAKLKSRKNIPLKTYGRPIRRSQTMVYASSSSPNERAIVDIVDREIGRTISMKRQLQTYDEGGSATISVDSKRVKKSFSSYQNLFDCMTVTLESKDDMDVPPIATDHSSSNPRPPTSEMPPNSLSRKCNFSDLPSTGINAQIPGTTDSTTKRETISTFPDNENAAQANSSIVIIPNSLTEAQKSQYRLISVESSIGSQNSSQPEMVDTADAMTAFTDGSSTLSIDNPLQNVLPANNQVSASIIQISLPRSSPTLSSANRNMKRAISEAALEELACPVALTSPSKDSKRVKRRKTFTSGEEHFGREASIDELSLAPQSRSDTTAAKRLGVRKEKKRDSLGEEKYQVVEDESFGSDEIGIPAERYQPRPSLRRAKSMSIQPAKTITNNDQEKSRRRRRKIDQITGDQTGSITTDMKSSVGADTGGDATSIDLVSLHLDVGGLREDCQIGKSEASAEVQSFTDTSKEAEALGMVSKAVLQPKRRGRPRKKTSEFVVNGDENVSETQSIGLNRGVSSMFDKESIVLKEIDRNESPFRKPVSTPSTFQTSDINEVDAGNTPSKSKETTDSQFMQTPKREAKKGTDQHSPLQSSRIAYRVGLSKKTRIAPLLKVIKKP